MTDDILAEVRALLAQVREAIAPPPIVYPSTAEWNQGNESTPLADIQEVARRFAEKAKAGTTITLPSGEQYNIEPTDHLQALASMLDRLAFLLEMSPQERAFVQHTVEHPTDFVNLEVFADYLEEQQRPADVEVVRRLTPRTGDVIVYRCTSAKSDPERQAVRDAAVGIQDRLAELGIQTTFLVMASQSGWEVETLKVEDGDVVVLTTPPDIITVEHHALLNDARNLERECERSGKRVSVFIKPADIGLEALDARLLAHHGLMRTDLHEHVFGYLKNALTGEPEGEEGGLVSTQAMKMIQRLKRERQELQAALAAEREACARIALEEEDLGYGSRWVADQIRRRGEGQQP